MKTLLKVDELELIRNYKEIVLLKSGIVVAKFANEQLLQAIVELLSLASQRSNNLAGVKLMTNFQPDLF